MIVEVVVEGEDNVAEVTEEIEEIVEIEEIEVEEDVVVVAEVGIIPIEKLLKMMLQLKRSKVMIKPWYL